MREITVCPTCREILGTEGSEWQHRARWYFDTDTLKWTHIDFARKDGLTYELRTAAVEIVDERPLISAIRDVL